MPFSVTVQGQTPEELKEELVSMLEYLSGAPGAQLILPFKSAVAAPKPVEEDSTPITASSIKADEAASKEKRKRRTNAEMEADRKKELAKDVGRNADPLPQYPTKAEATKALIALNDAKDIEACRVVLSQFKVENISGLTEDKYADLIAACKKEMPPEMNTKESVL